MYINNLWYSGWCRSTNLTAQETGMELYYSLKKSVITLCKQGYIKVTSTSCLILNFVKMYIVLEDNLMPVARHYS